MLDVPVGVIHTSTNGKVFHVRKERNGDQFDAEMAPAIGEVVLKLVGRELSPHQVVLYMGNLVLVSLFEKSIGDLYSFGGDTLYRVCPLGETAKPIVLGGPEAKVLAGKSATLFLNCEWLPKYIGTNGLLTDEQPVVAEAPKAPKATKKTTKKSTTKRAKVRNNWSGRA